MTNHTQSLEIIWRQPDVARVKDLSKNSEDENEVSNNILWEPERISGQEEDL